jgi:electron transfer flavoprotein alpha subunit
MTQIFAYILHDGATLDDTAKELLAAAKKIDASALVTAIVGGDGSDLDEACDAAAALFPEVWKIGSSDMAYPNAEIVRKALINIVPSKSIVLVPHEHFGMDLAPGLSIKLKTAYVADVVGVEALNDSVLKLVRQEYSGMVSTHVTCDIISGAVLTVRPGSFQANETADAAGKIVDKSSAVGDLSTERKFLEIVAAEVGDVDITKSEVLVSIGRGIEDEDNIELAHELATAMSADVSCSRPIVDAKWMEKSRQVGTSGQTVKPKVYLAMGISGSFQHLGGIKGSPFIIAVNKNPKAPIFQVADIGIVADILEFIPALAEKINEFR